MMCNKNSLCVSCCSALQLKVQRFIQPARLRMRLTMSAQGVDSDTASENTVALFLEKEWMRPQKSAGGLDTSLFFNKSNMCTYASLPSAFEVLDI